MGETGLCLCLRSYLERLVVLLPEPGDLRPSQCVLPAKAPVPLDRLTGDGRQQRRGLVESGPGLLELGEKDTAHSRKVNQSRNSKFDRLNDSKEISTADNRLNLAI